MWTFLAAAAVAAPCESPVGLDTFRSDLELGWQDLREGGFTASRQKLVALTQAIGCLEGPLSPDDAARYHRNRAVDAMFAGDESGAEAAARAAARLAPTSVTTWAQEVQAFADLLPTGQVPVVTEEFGTSLAGMVVVDGAEVPRRHVGQPLLVQVFDPDGTSIQGTWVDARDPVPDWVAFPPVACPVPASVSDLLAQSAAAEAAYVALDVPGFNRSLAAVAAGLPCLPARVSTQQAAVVHRLEGLRLYTLGAEAAALRSFQQAHALDPRYEPPESMVRPGSALAELWSIALRASSAPWILSPTPAGVALVVDGTPTSSRPAALPSIVQVATPTGAILWTRYVPANVVLPDLDFLAVEAQTRAEASLPPGEATYLDFARRRTKRTRRAGLVLAGVATLTGSVVLYSENTRLVGDFRERTAAPERLGDIRRDANLTATGSSVLLATSLGLFGAAFVLP